MIKLIGLILVGVMSANAGVAETSNRYRVNNANAASANTSWESSANGDELYVTAAKTAVAVGVEYASIPTAVTAASTMGVTASTGTAIASLSGAAATSATLASIGSAGTAALAVVGVAATPVVVGGVIVGVVASGVAWGINTLLFD